MLPCFVFLSPYITFLCIKVSRFWQQFRQIVKQNCKVRHHRVDITESSSAQFPTWIFNFGPYGRLRPVSENSSIMLKVSKFQKQIFLFSFPPKNEGNYFFYFCPKDLKCVQ